MRRNASILKVSHRDYRYKVSFRETTSDGNTVRRYSYFITKKEAEGFAEQKELAIQNHGAKHSHVADEERGALILYRQWAAKHPNAPSLAALLQQAIQSVESAAPRFTVAEAVAARVESAERRKLSSVHIIDLRWRLKRFQDEFGTRQIADVKASEVESWLHRLEISPSSWGNHARVIGSVFNLAVKRGYISASPLKKMEAPKAPTKSPAIFSSTEITKVLSVAPPTMLPLLVLQAFCGLRREEANRLRWGQIHLDAETPYVECPAEITKTSHRRICYVPPCAVEWLRPLCGLPSALLTVTKHYYDARLREIITASGVRWHNNGLRHSFASYRLAVLKNASEVAEEMGNSVAKIRVHYQNICTPQQAAAWWQVFPSVPPAPLLFSEARAS